MFRDLPRQRGSLPLDPLRLVPRVQQLLRRSSADLFPGLDAAGVRRVTEAIQEVLAQRESSARRRAAARVLDIYRRLDQKGQARFFELLARRYRVEEEAVTVAVETLQLSRGGDRAESQRALRRPLTLRYSTFVQAITGLPNGVKMLVDLRRDLLALGPENAALGILNDELARLLAPAFDAELLELVRITWEGTSASMLEHLMACEAVHEIEGWGDLKNRLDPVRRCYAFLHPGMPDEPLVFVEAALTVGLAGKLPHLLSPGAPHTDPVLADTAVFYSITNCQPGLAGVNLGNELIKRVIEQLRRDLPHIRSYATLSPMPGFRRWADAQLQGGGLSVTERRAFGLDAPELAPILASDCWTDDSGPAHQLRPGLLSLAARYASTTENGRALDPVGHFHLSNGAKVERINWLANRAPYELRRSYGVMVNYKYEPELLERNAHDYLARGTITVSGRVHDLVL